MNALTTFKTRVIDDAAGLHVIYCDTEIVTRDRAGNITLRFGGYDTQATRKRMNQAALDHGLPIHVSREGKTTFIVAGIGDPVPVTDALAEVVIRPGLYDISLQGSRRAPTKPARSRRKATAKRS